MHEGFERTFMNKWNRTTQAHDGHALATTYKNKIDFGYKLL